MVYFFRSQDEHILAVQTQKEFVKETVETLTWLFSEAQLLDIKVIEGEKGLFIAMPSRKAADGDYRDIAHPINQGARERIQSMILAEYEKASQEEE